MRPLNDARFLLTFSPEIRQNCGRAHAWISANIRSYVWTTTHSVHCSIAVKHRSTTFDNFNSKKRAHFVGFINYQQIFFVFFFYEMEHNRRTHRERHTQWPFSPSIYALTHWMPTWINLILVFVTAVERCWDWINHLNWAVGWIFARACDVPVRCWFYGWFTCFSKCKHFSHRLWEKRKLIASVQIGKRALL